MTDLARITAALRAACLSVGVPTDGADDLSGNLGMAIHYGFDGTVDALIEGTVERRLTARGASDFVLDPAIADALTAALIAVAKECRRVCTDCGGFAACDFCSDEAA